MRDPAGGGVRLLRVGCEFVHVAEVDTPAVVHIEPLQPGPVRVLTSQFSVEPVQPVRGCRDLYGNHGRRLTVPAGRSALRFDARVAVADAAESVDATAPEVGPDRLPDHALVYTRPSRYALSDVLGGEAWARFGGLRPGYRRVQAICDHVHGHLEFRYGSSGPQTTAADVNLARAGVCRDFTHLAISFCRALNIPARYVFGYLPDLDVPADPAPMDFAAWMEVWLGDRWWTFDPRNNRPRKGRVVIARGRDAADAAMITTFGGPRLEAMTVHAFEEPPTTVG